MSFFFYMKVPNGFEPICNSFTEDEQKYGFAYGIKGLLLDKIKEYPDGNKLPITLEVNNTVARKMYQTVGFCDTGIRYGEDCAYVKILER